MHTSHMLGLTVIVALSLAACGPKEESPPAQKTGAATEAPGVTVKIAHAGPLTGKIGRAHV